MNNNNYTCYDDMYNYFYLRIKNALDFNEGEANFGCSFESHYWVGLTNGKSGRVAGISKAYKFHIV